VNYSPQTPNDGFRNGGLFGMAALRNGGPTPANITFDPRNRQ